MCGGGGNRRGGERGKEEKRKRQQQNAVRFVKEGVVDLTQAAERTAMAEEVWHRQQMVDGKKWK